MDLPILQQVAQDTASQILESFNDNGNIVWVKLGEYGEYIKFERIVNATGEYITAHPYKSAFYAVNVITVIFPGLGTVQLLRLLGFGAAGPVAGSWAATVHNMIGTAKAKSLFATLQSAGMGGYGAPIVNGMVRGVSLGSQAALAVWRSTGKKQGRNDDSTVATGSIHRGAKL